MEDESIEEAVLHWLALILFLVLAAPVLCFVGLVLEALR